MMYFSTRIMFVCTVPSNLVLMTRFIGYTQTQKVGKQNNLTVFNWEQEKQRA
jgi:hypothetical protein